MLTLSLLSSPSYYVCIISTPHSSSFALVHARQASIKPRLKYVSLQTADTFIPLFQEQISNRKESNGRKGIVVDGHGMTVAHILCNKILGYHVGFRSVPAQAVFRHDWWADVRPATSLRIATVAGSRCSSATKPRAIAAAGTCHQI